ncbi:MAG: hypothetical protein WCR42_09995 [bacterium]
MLNDIINYGVRVVIILVGILFASGVLTGSDNNPMLRIIGIIAILFGLYRIIMYRRNKVKYNNFNKGQKDSKTDKFYYDDFEADDAVEVKSDDSDDDN